MRGAASARVADSPRALAMSCTMGGSVIPTLGAKPTRGITLQRFVTGVVGRFRTSRGGSRVTTTTPGGRVLIVDDDKALRHALAVLLQDAGYQTEQAGDGPEALDALGRQTVDCMLLDIGLPGMSGL